MGNELAEKVYVVTEAAGVGSLLTVVAVYADREHARAHIATAKRLMPHAANRLELKEFPLLAGFEAGASP